MGNHCLARTRRALSANADARPVGAAVELLVIHCISLPPGEFGAGLVEPFFTNQLDCTADPRLQDLKEVRVSAHLFIDRRGRTTQQQPSAQKYDHHPYY